MLSIYVDGSCFGNGKVNFQKRVGVGIVFPDKSIPDIGLEIHDLENKTNNVAELMAIQIALEIIDCNITKIGKDFIKIKDNPKKQIREINIYTDSLYSKKILTEWYDKWIKEGKLDNKKNIKIIEKIKYLMTIIPVDINIIWIKGHSTNKYNVLADKYARGEI